jgi:hypothetical protein
MGLRSNREVTWRSEKPIEEVRDYTVHRTASQGDVDNRRREHEEMRVGPTGVKRQGCDAEQRHKMRKGSWRDVLKHALFCAQCPEAQL